MQHGFRVSLSPVNRRKGERKKQVKNNNVVLSCVNAPSKYSCQPAGRFLLPTGHGESMEVVRFGAALVCRTPTETLVNIYRPHGGVGAALPVLLCCLLLKNKRVDPV